MAAQLLATEGIVLDRQPAAESFLRLSCLSPEHGLLDVLQRQSRRAAAAAPVLDLFDSAQLSLESSNQGRTWFVREAALLQRRGGLAASYPALTQACRLARVITQNPIPEESRAGVHALTRRALDAWETGVRPDAIYFKSLYLLARDEGHPVREDWGRQLPARDRALVEDVLRQPAAAQETGEPDVDRLTRALEAYLRGHLDINVGH